MGRRLHSLLFSLVAVTPALADGTDKPRVDLGLFVDGYYAWDTNRPPGHTRPFTTVPARANEFSINLAYVDAKVAADRFRGRVAFQAGTSVDANYAATEGAFKFLQEANAGYRLADGLWIDAGIFLSHIGLESFISKDNWNYTRSLVADFSPYYQAGVRLSYEWGPRWSFQVLLLNGWQNIVENNEGKALGTQIVFRPTEKLSFTHNTFLGDEGGTRFFQDFFVKLQLAPWWETAFIFDFGTQGGNQWYGVALLQRFRLAESTFLAARVEAYADPDGVIVPTKTPNNFQALGASLNIDHALTSQLLWRNELRWLTAKDSIFPGAAGPQSATAYAVSSLSLSL